MIFTFRNNFLNLNFRNWPEMEKNQFVDFENGRSTDTQVGLIPYLLLYKSNLCKSLPFPLFNFMAEELKFRSMK